MSRNEYLVKKKIEAISVSLETLWTKLKKIKKLKYQSKIVTFGNLKAKLKSS